MHLPDQLVRGLYDLLVTQRVEEALATLDETLGHRQRTLPRADAPDRIAFYLSGLIRHVVEALPEDKRLEGGLALARTLVAALDSSSDRVDLLGDMPVSSDVLDAVLKRLPDGSVEALVAPMIPLLDTTLLTNAPGEPRVGNQLQTEIESADRIDILMAFIRRSGLRPLLASLARLCENGGVVRVLTTTYTNSTEPTALEALRALGADVRVSYDTSTTRLHAKAWLFHRHSGFSTAYIGSSNLTHSAQVSGLEWNVRVSGARNPDVIEKIDAVFESYWESGDYRKFDRGEFDKITAAEPGQGPTVFLSPLEVRPMPFQERLLEQLQLARQQGHHQNLLVAATGTGKTVMAALDYAALRDVLPRARLLFVAHRKELLEQARATFGHVLRETTFGESWVAGARPSLYEHVFASVQSLDKADLSLLAVDHFDVVIIDEFHHAAANTYTRLLRHLQPRELLGLTATPERTDGQSVLDWFGGRIAAELRLWDAIDQQYLVPFSYFGVHDGVDLAEIPWRRGRGYDVEALTSLYTSTDAWANIVVKQFLSHVDDIAKVRALGFCVSVKHARYMARMFSGRGIEAVAVTGEDTQSDREAALGQLNRGKLRVVFSVDIFNEGIDVPAVDTLLMLRPTDSPVLFLQQLGRGLRRNAGKTSCLVLDFVGQHRKEFRFDRKFRALLGGTRKTLAEQVVQQFPFLPAGCHMSLDRVAADIVLRNLKDGLPSGWLQLVAELKALVGSGLEVSLASYLEQTGLQVDDVYANGRSWSDMLESAGLAILARGPHEVRLRRAVGRLLHVNDAERLRGYAELLSDDRAPAIADLPARDRRVARMLAGSLADSIVDRSVTLQVAVDLVWEHPQVRAEVRELMGLLGRTVDHVHVPLRGRSDVPLLVHARYSRIEILAAFNVGEGAKAVTWREGVRWVPDAKADLFVFTLDKSSGSFSPTTRYRDYAISPELIHWESQATTTLESPTGQRYLNHVAQGSDVYLFARLNNTDRAFWCLGPARYVSHKSSRPIAINWRLEQRLPGDLFASFRAAVA